MTQPASSGHLLECASCGNVGFGLEATTCCGRSMDAVGEGDVAVSPPSLDELLRTVFDMSETELDICLCVMEGGEQTVADLADRVDYDRSVVSRHLNHLADLGVLDKRRRLLEAGGQVYVYAPEDQAVVRERLAGAFAAWATQSADLIDSLTREKVEAMAETEDDDAQWKIYQE